MTSLLDLGTAVGYLMLDSSGFKSGVNSALSDFKILGDKSATIADKFAGVGAGLTTAGKGLTTGVTLPLLGIGAAALTVGNDFEAQMSRVQGTAGATAEEMKLLNDQALQLGADTSFSAKAAAEGMENLASAGFNTEEIMDAMPGLLDLAASSGAELGRASEIAAASIRGFGLDASDAGHVADVFARAAADTNAQVEDMGEAMKYIAPVAKAMGQSIEETAAAIGIMSDAGIKGSQAGTSLRGALSKLVLPSENAAMLIQEMGLEFFNAEGQMRPLNEIVSELSVGFSHLTDEQRNQNLITLFGQESLSGMLALIDRGPESLKELTESFENADGAAAEMATTMLDNTAGSVEQMFGSLETLGIKIQQVIAPVVRDVVDKITEFINSLSSMDAESLQLVVTIAGVAAALGPVLLIFGKLASAIGSVITLVGGAGGLSGVLAALTGPIGVIVAAVSALALAWATDFAGIRETVSSIMDSIQSIIESVWGTIQRLWDENFLNIQGIVTTWWEVFQLYWQTIFDTIAGIFEVFSLAFQGDWEGVWDKLQEIAENIWDNLVTAFSMILDTVVNTLIGIGARIWQAAKDVFNRLLDGAKEIWTTITTWLSGVIEDPVGTVLGIGEKLFEAGKTLFTSLWDGLKSIWQDITDWVSGAVNWLLEKVQFWKDTSDELEKQQNMGLSGGGELTGQNAVTGMPSTSGPMTSGGSKGGFGGSTKIASNTMPGGDTYNFYSPEALTPVRAAKEMKRAKQELTLGF